MAKALCKIVTALNSNIPALESVSQLDLDSDSATLANLQKELEKEEIMWRDLNASIHNNKYQYTWILSEYCNLKQKMYKSEWRIMNKLFNSKTKQNDCKRNSMKVISNMPIIS